MKLKVKNLAIGTGNPMIALINYIDAEKCDLHFSDRIKIIKNRKEVTATVDITNSSEIIEPGEIGLFEEAYREINAKDDDIVRVCIDNPPASLSFIRKKLRGKRLNYEETRAIVDDIINNKLTDIELSYYVASTYMAEMTTEEIVHLTRAIVNTGQRLKLKDKIIVDKHCIGGVAANRTTMLIVPIVAAAGITIPKTSSRAITSASGTADTVEVLANVVISKEKMQSIVSKTGGCFVWGGAVNLAPADDKIIKVERPLSLDPVGQLVASILAKKKSASATHVLIDIPIGRGSKTESKKKALVLKRRFENVSKRVGMKVKVIITNGTQPIGNGIGPALEARDVLWTLQNSKLSANDLKEKSIMMAGEIFDLIGKTKKGQGKKLAKEILESGRAYLKFIEILKAQGEKVVFPEQIEIGKYSAAVAAAKRGKIMHIDNKRINKIARVAGCPVDHGAGVYLNVKKGSHVKKSEILYWIYSNSKEKLKYAKQTAECKSPIIIKS